MATEVMTAPEGRIIHKTYAVLSGAAIPQRVHVTQYDESLPVIACTLYKDGQLYTIPDGASVRLRMNKNGLPVYHEAMGIDDARHVVYLEITTQMTVLYGEFAMVIEVETSDGKTAGTSYLRLIVRQNPVQNPELDNIPDYTANSNRLTAEGVKKLQDESSTQQKAIEDKGKNTLESIPADYSTLSGKVDENTSGISELKNITILQSSVEKIWVLNNRDLDDSGNLIGKELNYVMFYAVYSGQTIEIFGATKYMFGSADNPSSDTIIGKVENATNKLVVVPTGARRVFLSVPNINANNESVFKVETLPCLVGEPVDLGPYIDQLISIGDRASKSYTNAPIAIGIESCSMIVDSDNNVGDNGKYNTAVGHRTLSKCTTGNHNTAIGWGSSASLTSGSGNTALGEDSLLSCTESNGNTAVGHRAMQSLQTGENNTVVGTSAMYFGGYIPSGNYNTYVGAYSGHVTGNGNDNVAVGYRAIPADGVSNSIVIGSNINCGLSNALMLGNSNTATIILGNKKIIFSDDGTVKWENFIQ